VRILYVEDDPTAQEYIARGLTEHGYTVDVASDGREGFDLALSHSHGLIILDVTMPNMSGFELVKALRSSGVETPVLFLSARDTVSDRVRGLNLGGDDYITKPFAFSELLARIQALTRRHVLTPEDGRLRVGDLELDIARHTARRGGAAVELTMKETSLLEYMMERTGQVLSRIMITERVWGPGFDAYSNVIDVHINHLRKKVDPARNLIHTVKGVGYVLEDRTGGAT
jgi:two-component system copper resistance phosphate regulon response regulator CusR